MRKTITLPGRLSTALFALLWCVSSVMFGQTFSSGDVMAVPTGPANQPASVYPSNIVVSGAPTTITGMSVTLNAITHTWPDDYDIVLVAPNGNSLVLMSDCGGSTDANGVTITFSDNGAGSLPTSGGLSSGTFLPTDYTDGTDAAMPAGFNGSYTSSAPTGSASFGSQFVGSDANGVWSLYVRDEFNFDGGSISGWSINFVESIPGCTDINACNYNPVAQVNDGTCSYPGCTSPDACNYDSTAGCDDGSCCFNQCVILAITAGAFPTEIGWEFYDPTGALIDSGPFGTSSVGGYVALNQYCLPEPGCNYSIVMTDDFGDGWNGGTYTFLDFQGNIYSTGTLANADGAGPVTVTFPIGGVLGCTDVNATNYNPIATCDDGSCISCPPGSSLYTVDMSDTGNNGWNGGSYNIADIDGISIYTGSLDAAVQGDGTAVGIDNVCLSPGCYSITISGSTNTAQIGFNILDGSSNQVIGLNAPYVTNGAAVGFSIGGAECAIAGCTNVDCFNYNPYAVTDDGSCLCAPDNDNCSNAVAISCGSTLDGTVAFATSDTGVLSCLNAGGTNVSVSTGGVWYTFTGNGGPMTITTCGTNFDTKLHVYSGSCGNFTCVSANDDSCTGGPSTLASTVSFQSTAGTQYYALVTRYSATTTGTDFVISLDCGTVWDIIQASPVHTTLETAVLAAGLDGALSGTGPFTVFAPTDAAFAALPAGALDALLADPTGALANVLLYHVAAGQTLSTDLSNGQTIVTLQGNDVTVTINGNGVFINNAQVIIADLVADNGVVHVIDAVLLPAVEPTVTVMDIIAASEVHTTLESALVISGLNTTLSTAGPFTVFAPTDAAFAALPAGVLDALLADPTGALTNVLLYHVVSGTALSTDLSDGQIIQTVLGQDVTITIVDGNVFVNGAQVIVADLVADNGVVHVIDAVLVPAAVVASFNYDANEICQGEVVLFTDNSQFTLSDGTSWEWSITGPETLTASGPEAVITFNIPGTYSATLTVTDALGNTASTTVDNAIIVSEAFTLYADEDGDGFGGTSTIQSCGPVFGYVDNADDCDDTNASVYPGAQETCNLIDDNCNTSVDEGVQSTFYLDADGDGYGVAGSTTLACSVPEGYAVADGDCDDGDPSINPGAAEICNTIDENCNDQIDEGVQTTFYADVDGDGYGDNNNTFIGCSAPAGFISTGGDCDDSNAAVRPGAVEACDGLDNNCNTETDEGCFGPAPDNDESINAISINATAYNVTQPLYGNLFNATPSSNFVGTVPSGSGQDVWYKFTSTSEAVRIRVYSATNNLMIQLQDGSGNVIANENALNAAGTEILNVDGLTPNTLYYVAVRNLNSVGGNYVINVRRYDPSQLSTTVAQTLCGSARSVFTNANSYTFSFTGQTSGTTYTRTVNNTTVAMLSTVTGMEAGQVYNTTVNAVFLPTNSVGTVEIMNVEGVVTLPFTVSPSAPMSLRATDVCPAVKTLSSQILAQPFNCGAVDFQWEFTRTAPSASLPVTFLKGNSSRFLQLATVPGIQSGASYNVRVRPRFANGSYGQWGPVSCVSTVGVIGLVEVDAETARPEVAANVNEMEAEAKLLIFPNPVQGNEVQLISDMHMSDCNVMITDLTGRRVANWQGFELNTGVTVFRPQTSLGAGVYMLHIESKDGSVSQRFIVE